MSEPEADAVSVIGGFVEGLIDDGWEDLPYGRMAQFASDTEVMPPDGVTIVWDMILDNKAGEEFPNGSITHSIALNCAGFILSVDSMSDGVKIMLDDDVISEGEVAERFAIRIVNKLRKEIEEGKLKLRRI
jgi:hypothetical protein